MVKDLITINLKTDKTIHDSGAGSESAMILMAWAQKLVEAIKNNWFVHKAELGDMFDHPIIIRAICTTFGKAAINY